MHATTDRMVEHGSSSYLIVVSQEQHTRLEFLGCSENTLLAGSAQNQELAADAFGIPLLFALVMCAIPNPHTDRQIPKALGHHPAAT